MPTIQLIAITCFGLLFSYAFYAAEVEAELMQYTEAIHDTAIYKNPAFGVEFQYPHNWIIDISRNGSYNLIARLMPNQSIIVGEDSSAVIEIYLMVPSQYNNYAISEIPLEQIVNQRISDLHAGGANFSGDAPQNQNQVNGNDAYKLEYEFVDLNDGLSYTFMETILASNVSDSEYILLISAPSTESEKYFQNPYYTFNRILESFETTEPQTEQGTIVFATFLSTISASMVAAILLSIRRWNTKDNKKESRWITGAVLGVTVFFAIMLVLAIYLLAPQFVLNYLMSISSAAERIGLPEATGFAAISAIIPATIAYSWFRTARRFILSLGPTPRFMLIAAIAMFLIGLCFIMATPISLLTSSIVTFTQDNQLIDDYNWHLFELWWIYQGAYETIQVPVVVLLLIVLAIAFIILVIADLINRRKMHSTRKIKLIHVGLFVVLPSILIVVLFFSSENPGLFNWVILTPIGLSLAVTSFLAAGGYTVELKKRAVIAKETSKRSDGNSSSGWRMKGGRRSRLWAIVVLIVFLISLERLAMLLPSGVVAEAGVISEAGFFGTLDVNWIFFKLMEIFFPNPSETEEHRMFIWHSVTAFFSLFWVLDLLMLAKRFDNDFLESSAHASFTAIKNRFGELTTIAFLGLFVFFSNPYLLERMVDNKEQLMYSMIENHINNGESPGQNNQSDILPLPQNIYKIIAGLFVIVGILYYLFGFEKLKKLYGRISKLRYVRPAE